MKYPEALNKIKIYQKDHSAIHVFTMCEKTKLKQFNSSVLCNAKALAFQSCI